MRPHAVAYIISQVLLCVVCAIGLLFLAIHITCLIFQE